MKQGDKVTLDGRGATVDWFTTKNDLTFAGVTFADTGRTDTYEIGLDEIGVWAVWTMSGRKVTWSVEAAPAANDAGDLLAAIRAIQVG